MSNKAGSVFVLFSNLLVYITSDNTATCIKYIQRHTDIIAIIISLCVMCSLSMSFDKMYVYTGKMLYFLVVSHYKSRIASVQVSPSQTFCLVLFLDFTNELPRLLLVFFPLIVSVINLSCTLWNFIWNHIISLAWP